MQAAVEFCQSSVLQQDAGDGGTGWGELKRCGLVRWCLLVKHFEHIWVVQSFARHTDAFEGSKIKKS